jgi:protein-tyrosine-phosphatase
MPAEKTIYTCARRPGRCTIPYVMREIVFVCTGNTCRSPMAEGLLRAALPARWRDGITVSSAGTHAWDGQPAASLSVKAMKEKGIDISGHRARLVTPDIINKASLVVALAGTHLAWMKTLVQGAGEWMIVLGDLDDDRADKDVHDPIGGGLEDYRSARDDISGLIGPLIDYLRERFGLPGAED